MSKETKVFKYRAPLSLKKSFVWALILALVGLISACSKSAIPAPVDNFQVTYSQSPEFHHVKSGDTFYSIAWRYEIDPLELAKLNQVESPYAIKVGERLRLRELMAMPYHPRPEVHKPIQLAKRVKDVRPSEQKTSSQKTKEEKKIPPKKEAIQLATVSKGFIWPVDAPKKIVEQGKGVDIFGKIGESIKSVGDGQVVYSGSGLKHYGNLIIVRHPEGILSAYAQNDKRLVKEGEVVKKGQVIAEMGQIGHHSKLYFEMRRGGVPVDPLLFLPKRS